MTNTTLENKITILADLWFNYKSDEDFFDFIIYNDIGLPLAYLLDTGLCIKTDKSDNFIIETFDLLISTLEIEDVGFTNLNEVFLLAEGE